MRLNRRMLGRALLTFVAAFCAASAAPAALRPVVQQKAEMSCGAAALATMLAWRGRTFTEGALLETLRRRVLADRPEALARVEREGVSAGELQSVAELVVDNLRIEAVMLTLEQAETLARTEAYIVHLVEGSANGPSRQHFSVVAGLDPKRGFLRADSFDGRHVFQRKEHFARSALTKRNGSRMLALRLVYAGGPATSPEDLSPGERASVRDIAASRLLTSLTGDFAGASTVTISLGHAREKLSLADGAITLRSATTAASLVVEHSFGRAGSLAVEVPVSTRRATLNLGSAATASTGTETRLAPATIRFSRELGLGLPANSRTALAIGARVKPNGLSGLNMGTATTWTLGGKTAVQGQFFVDLDRAQDGWSAGVQTTIGIVRMLDRSTLGGFNVIAAKSFGRGDALVEVGLSLERTLSRSWSVGISASRNLLGPAGYSGFGYGISLTYRPSRKVF